MSDRTRCRPYRTVASYRQGDIMPDNVKCAECGFLALRDLRSRALYEAEEDFRNAAKIPPSTPPGVPGVSFDNSPLCLMRKENFSRPVDSDGRSQLVRYSAATDEGKGDLLEIIQRVRTCDGFTEWQCGFTPSEHEEMKLLEEQRNWQREQERENRAWQAAESAKADTRHKENSDAAHAQHRRELIIMGGIVTCALVAAEIASGLIGLLGQPPVVNVQVPSLPANEPVD